MAGAAGARTPGPGFELLALWSVTGPDAGVVALDADAETAAPRAVRWQLGLSADPIQAEARLAALQASLDVMDEALGTVEDRMRVLATTETAGDAIFDVQATPAISDAELELLETLGIVEVSAEMDSLSVPSRLPKMPWEEARNELRELLEQVRQLTTHFAWVETKVQGALVARTVVSWTGNFRAVWPALTESEERRTHERSLALALRSRVTLVRTVAVITAGAVGLLPRLTTPASAALALPAIWKYIMRVRSELETARQPEQEA